MERPFFDAFLLRMKNNKESIFCRKIWSHRYSILSEFVDCFILIYNGKTHVRCKITERKVGHKFGEFASTRPSRSNKGAQRKGKKGEKSSNKRHMPRKGNPVSARLERNRSFF